MFKKFSKLMILALGVLTVFAACTEDNKGEGSITPPVADTFLENVGGKSFTLVTGTSNSVSKENGNIMDSDGLVVFYTFVKEINKTDAVYTNDAGNYFGVKYISATTPKLDFYFAKNGTTADYWATADAVKFVAGADVLLATATIGEEAFTNGMPSDNITTVDDEVPSGGGLSAVLNISKGEFLVLADNKSANEPGSLFTGSMSGKVTRQEVAKEAVGNVDREPLQLIDGTPVIVNNDINNVNLYDDKGVAVVGGDGLSVSIAGVDHVTGAGHVAINDASSVTETKLYKINATGFTTTAVATIDTMLPQSIITIGTDIYIGGVKDRAPVISKVTNNVSSKVDTSSLPQNKIGLVRLVNIKGSLYAVVSTTTMNTLHKYNGSSSWTKVTGITTDEADVITSIIADEKYVYINTMDRFSSDITAYTVDSAGTTFTQYEEPKAINTNTQGVDITTVSLGASAVGILVVNVEEIDNKRVIRYHNLKAGSVTVPFTMPDK